jgi:hypothetical protein
MSGPQGSTLLGGYLISVENFSDSRQVQPGCFADLAQRQARLSRTLKGFPASYADLIALAVNAREFRLSALHLGAGLVLGVLCHAGQPSRLGTFRRTPVRGCS